LTRCWLTFEGNPIFTSNPFAELTAFLAPLFMQVYIVLMIIAVAVGTLVDRLHQGSTKIQSYTVKRIF
jgi:hypothetical protein